MNYRSALFLILFAVVFAAGFPRAQGATPPDPCKVITKQAASTAIGGPITSIQARNLGTSTNCSFKGAKLFRWVQITTFRYGSPSEAKSTFERTLMQTASMLGPTAPVSGIGDQAARTPASLYVLHGDAVFVFAVVDGTVGPGRVAKAIVLAKKASLR
ncbi:MAG: hypothetical protein DLM50_07940 [Candidatus Meridianibacter frigidus]|nr:MAG: hypothetical protein DLM50_07940 [Candidatus Eremiobacteraeota bacterium]